MFTALSVITYIIVMSTTHAQMEPSTCEWELLMTMRILDIAPDVGLPPPLIGGHLRSFGQLT